MPTESGKERRAGVCVPVGPKSLAPQFPPCEVGWQLPHELWPDPPGGSDMPSWP